MNIQRRNSPSVTTSRPSVDLAPHRVVGSPRPPAAASAERSFARSSPARRSGPARRTPPSRRAAPAAAAASPPSRRGPGLRVVTMRPTGPTANRARGTPTRSGSRVARDPTAVRAGGPAGPPRDTRARWRPNHAPRQKWVPDREREVRALLAMDVEPIRVRPPARIAVRRREHRADQGALLQARRPPASVARVVCRVDVPTGPAHRSVSSTAGFTSDRSARTSSNRVRVRAAAPRASAR